MEGHYRWERLAWAMVLYALFPIAWFLHPFIVNDREMSTCFFQNITGKPCPFCGLTRAFACFMHGDINRAFQYHGLWWVFVILVLLFASLSFFDAIFKKNILGKLCRPWQGKEGIILAILLALTFIRWMLL